MDRHKGPYLRTKTLKNRFESLASVESAELELDIQEDLEHTDQRFHKKKHDGNRPRTRGIRSRISGIAKESTIWKNQTNAK